MVLITGGAYQGKTEFAKELLMEKCGMIAESKIADGMLADQAQMEEALLITNLHQWIAKILREERDPYREAEQLIRKNPDVVLVVNELGCGIVPVDAFDRNWREVTGRVCCQLAKEADAVYRVTCGIGTKIR